VPLLVSDPVADVVAAVEKLRADDRLITSPGMLLGDAEMLLEAMNGIESVLVRRMREAAQADATSEIHGRGTKAWLVEDLLVAGPRASKLMRLVRALPLHPLTEAAYDEGAISTDHAAAILSALSHLPCAIRDTVEPHLIERAKEFPPEEIAGFVDDILVGLGLEKDADVRRERRNAERGVDVNKTMHGSRALAGTLSPEVGEQLERALDIAGQRCGDEDDRTQRQRNHDALGAIVNAFLAQNGAPSFTGAPRTVIVTIPLETLENELADAWATMPSGARISAATARRLACDAEKIPVVLGGRSEILDVGQAGRDFTSAVRRAAWLRDGGRCAFPDCRNTILELHHITFKRHGGTNSVDNAAWLCLYHHWLVHEAGWTLQRQIDGSYLWTSPHGRQRVRHLSTA